MASLTTHDTSHTGDLVNLQPDPFEHLAATCFADSESGASLFVHQVQRFERGIRPPLPAEGIGCGDHHHSAVDHRVGDHDQSKD